MLIERCAHLVVRTRRMLLSAVQAQSICAEDAQALVAQLVTGLPTAADADVAAWVAQVKQITAQTAGQEPPLGSATGDRLRQPAYLRAPTLRELEELELRVAALARQLPRPRF